jgi:Bacterial regulatory helix-turn-helix protein, lysR family
MTATYPGFCPGFRFAEGYLRHSGRFQNNSDPAQGPPRRPVTASLCSMAPDQSHWRMVGPNGEATPLQMQQVHYFLALCEELSFTRAARRCGISQP